MRKIIFLIKTIFVSINATIALLPFFLAVHYFNYWIENGKSANVSLYGGIRKWLNFDPMPDIVRKDLEGFWLLYKYMLGMPLFFWLIVLAIPSYVFMYKFFNSLDNA